MPSAPLPDSNAPKRHTFNYHLITNTKQPNKMEKKNIYETPEAILVDFQAEGVLCESGTGSINPNQNGEFDWLS